jgi:hypothetical protein
VCVRFEWVRYLNFFGNYFLTIKQFMKVLSALNFGSFPGNIMFSAGYTFDEVCEELKKQKCTDWLIAFRACKHLTGSGVVGFSSKQFVEIKGKEYEFCFVFLRDVFKHTDRHHAVLSHEVIHICTHHLRDMFDIVKENEAFAYTHTHILTQCYDVIRKAKKGKL